jgi:hypothetical protein
VQVGLLAGDGRRSLGDLPIGGGQGDQLHPVEFLPQVAPGVAGGVPGDPDEQQRQTAQLDAGANAASR